MNRFLLFFLFFCSPYLIFAQFSDDFSDGYFINNPTWNGDVSNFEVDTTKRLYTLYDTLDNEISLSPVSKVSLNEVWQFKFEYLFSPSSSNYTKVYIMSDKEDVITTLNGYFIKLGGVIGDSDDISLYSVVNGVESKIIDGNDNIVFQEKVTLLQGMYIVVVDFLSDNGFVNQYKKVVVLQR